jgi:hypothetical protein
MLIRTRGPSGELVMREIPEGIDPFAALRRRPCVRHEAHDGRGPCPWCSPPTCSLPPLVPAQVDLFAVTHVIDLAKNLLDLAKSAPTSSSAVAEIVALCGARCVVDQGDLGPHRVLGHDDELATCAECRAKLRRRA